MLKKALILIMEGFGEEKELAQMMRMDEMELASQLEEMCQKGYLKMSEEAPDMCMAGPNLRDDAGIGRTFALTEKGKKLIR
jgi:hypothetical protein